MTTIVLNDQRIDVSPRLFTVVALLLAHAHEIEQHPSCQVSLDVGLYQVALSLRHKLTVHKVIEPMPEQPRTESRRR